MKSPLNFVITEATMVIKVIIVTMFHAAKKNV